MAVNKLLVAFDESEGADRALAMAASLAAVNPEAHVDVVYVVPIPLLDETQMANFKDILDMMISDGEDLLAEAEQKMGEDVAARTDSLLLTGTNPATEIVKLIGQRDYDLLIV
ncbi:MAG: universal stress protein, partial [Eggerthella lenta]